MKARLVLKSLSEISVEEFAGGAANQPPRDHSEEPPQTAESPQAELEARPEDSVRFREDLLRRYDAPYPHAWLHGGLNE